jgi:hypothetical protein
MGLACGSVCKSTARIADVPQASPSPPRLPCDGSSAAAPLPFPGRGRFLGSSRQGAPPSPHMGRSSSRRTTAIANGYDGRVYLLDAGHAKIFRELEARRVG